MQKDPGPVDWKTKFVMICIILLQIPKTFNYMRLLPQFATIVAMLRDVSIDLVPFMTIYGVMVFLSSQTFAVLGLGVDGVRKKRLEISSRRMLEEDEGLSADERIGGRFLYFVFNSLRYGLGDYTIEDAKNLPFLENLLFWALWYFVVLVTVIIMLNFVVAEASKSYAEVDERLEATINIEKA